MSDTAAPTDRAAEKGEVARYSYARHYDLGTALNGFWRAPRHLVAAFQDVAGPIPAGAQIMDFGCGTGRVSRALLRAQPDLAITGVEPGAKMAAVYRDTLAKLPQCTLIEGGLDGDLSFAAADDRYDALLSAGVFDHIDFRDDTVLPRLLRVLKPGAHLAFTYERNPSGAPDYEVRRGIYHRYSDEFMAAAVIEAGAVIERRDEMFGFFRTTGISEGKTPQLAWYGVMVARKPALG